MGWQGWGGRGCWRYLTLWEYHFLCGAQNPLLSYLPLSNNLEYPVFHGVMGDGLFNPLGAQAALTRKTRCRRRHKRISVRQDIVVWTRTQNKLRKWDEWNHGSWGVNKVSEVYSFVLAYAQRLFFVIFNSSLASQTVYPCPWPEWLPRPMYPYQRKLLVFGLSQFHQRDAGASCWSWYTWLRVSIRVPGMIAGKWLY